MLVTLIVTVITTMTITFCCNLLEACTLSLSSTDIARISERKPGIGAIWKRFKQNIEKPIAVILILNTLAHTIGASLAGGEFTAVFGTRWVGLFSIAFSFVMVEWTELLPKSLGVRYNRSVATWAALPLRWVVPIFSPIIGFFELLNRPLTGKPGQGQAPDTVDDIRVLAEFASYNNQLSEDQALILARTMSLSERRVREIMVHMEEVKFLSADMTLADALVYAHTHQHTRLPLIDTQKGGEFVGYVNFKDIVTALRVNPTDPSLRGIARPILSLQENESLAAALGKLTAGYQHIAVVRNDEGKAMGIVTMEDMIEAIVGELEDEYDVVPSHLFQLAQGRYLAGGGVTMAELCRRIPQVRSVPEPRRLSDWLKHEWGRTPRPGEELVRNGCRFMVRKISRSNVMEVIIEVQNGAAPQT